MLLLFYSKLGRSLQRPLFMPDYSPKKRDQHAHHNYSTIPNHIQPEC
jgi:hypothetical protein